MVIEHEALSAMLARVECLIDEPALDAAIKALPTDEPGSDCDELAQALKELQSNLHMAVELKDYCSGDCVDAEALLGRLEVFGDTLAICDRITLALADHGEGSPYSRFDLRTRWAIEGAITAALALYGVLALLGRQAEGEIEYDLMARAAEAMGEPGGLRPVEASLAAQAAQADKAKAQPEDLRAVISAIVAEIPHRSRYALDGNAPGHAHRIPGVWDDDNGELAGKECGWCKAWAKAVEIDAQTKAAKAGGER